MAKEIYPLIRVLGKNFRGRRPLTEGTYQESPYNSLSDGPKVRADVRSDGTRNISADIKSSYISEGTYKGNQWVAAETGFYGIVKKGFIEE